MAMQPLPFSLGVVVIIVVSMVQLAFVDPVLLAVALALFPGLAILNNRYTKRVEEPASAAQARVGDVSAVAHESFEGALLVKTLGLEEREVDRLRARAEALRTERLVVGRLRAGFEPGLDALPNLGTIALLWLGAWRLSTGDITTGELVQAMALFGILAFPFRIVGLPPRGAAARGGGQRPRRRRAGHAGPGRAGSPGGPRRGSDRRRARRRPLRLRRRGGARRRHGARVAGRGRRPRRLDGRRQDDAVQPARAPHGPDARRGAPRRHRRSTPSTPRPCTAPSRWCSRSRSSSPTPCARTSPWATT